MTTYTTVADSEIDTDSPITESLMTRLRDNPIAITEKAAGAPVLANDYVVNAMLAAGAVTTAKITNSAVTTAKLDDDSVTRDKLISPSAGTTVIASIQGSSLISLPGSYLAAGDYYNDPANGNWRIGSVVAPGSVRVYFYINHSSGTSWVRLMVNGVSVDNNSYTSSGTYYLTATGVDVGDVLVLQAYNTSVSSMSGITVRADTAGFAAVVS